MRTFIENYLHFMKNCIRPPYEKLKSLKLGIIGNYLHFMKNCIRPPYRKLKPLGTGFIENSNFENDKRPLHGRVYTPDRWVN